MQLILFDWAAVDEEFCIYAHDEKHVFAKQKLFDEALKQAIPEITDAQIEQLRQAVAGEVNKGRAAICGQVTDEQGNLGSVAKQHRLATFRQGVVANTVTDSTQVLQTA